jgi:hypothetical protein
MPANGTSGAISDAHTLMIEDMMTQPTGIPAGITATDRTTISLQHYAI